MRQTLLLLITLLIIGGASWADKAGSVALEGLLEPAGPSIYMEGSHELHDARGNVIARLSGHEGKVDLKSAEGQWVKVIGHWRPTVEAGGQIFEVHSLAYLSHAP